MFGLAYLVFKTTYNQKPFAKAFKKLDNISPQIIFSKHALKRAVDPVGKQMQAYHSENYIIESP